MEKKITKKFYLLSSISFIAAIIMAWGNWKDVLALLGVLVVLMFNHLTLLKMVYEMTHSMTTSGADAQRALRKTLFLMFFKFSLLFALAAAIYFYNKDLTLKVLLLMIFQLIIQVVSIKNNY